MDRRPRIIMSLLLSVFTVAATGAIAQTYVAGAVSGIWDPSGNPYVATADLEVPAGQTLMIEPGVAVRFQDALALVVHGTLIAVGAPSDSISFAPIDGLSQWGGIQLLGAGAGTQLSCCTFTDARREAYPPAVASGGAVYSLDSSPLIANCTFERCSVEDNGDPPCGGGAIWCSGGEPRILANVFRECSAMAFCTTGGGAIGFTQTDITIHGNEIRDCWAHGMGGGIAGHASTVDIAHNVIAGCEGFHYGGGIGLRDDCTGTLLDNLIVENGVEDLHGGGVYVRDSDVEIVSCTIADNSAVCGGLGEGGGLYVGGNSSVWVDHGIFWGNSADTGPQISSQYGVFVDFCDVEGGFSGSGNFALDPLFVATGSGDYFLSCVAAGQGADSPCIDAGYHDVADDPALIDRSTRTDLVADTGLVDLGFHRAADPTSGVGAPRTPVFLAQNHPNPFNPSTVIRFTLPTACRATLAVYDTGGRRVATLLDGQLAAGGHEVVWHGRNDAGRPVASGVYVYRLDAGDVGGSRRMLLLK